VRQATVPHGSKKNECHDKRNDHSRRNSPCAGGHRRNAVAKKAKSTKKNALGHASSEEEKEHDKAEAPGRKSKAESARGKKKNGGGRNHDWRGIGERRGRGKRKNTKRLSKKKDQRVFAIQAHTEGNRTEVHVS